MCESLGNDVSLKQQQQQTQQPIQTHTHTLYPTKQNHHHHHRHHRFSPRDEKNYGGCEREREKWREIIQ